MGEQYIKKVSEMEKIFNIAVMLAGPDEEYQSNIISGINRFARENDVNISYFAAFGGMLASRSFDIGEYSIYNLVDFNRFDGVLLMTNTICDPDVKELIVKKVRKAGIPAVVIDNNEYQDMYDICINNSSAMEEIVYHVIREHNAKVINFISGPLSNPEARDRYDAFLKVMSKCDLEVDQKRIYFGEFRSHDGKQAVEEFAESGMSLPDAFICANDAMALTAASALQKLGYRIPEDVIVTGFDYTFNARNFCPALTSVKRPLFTSGYKACSIIYDVLSGGKPKKSTVLEAYPVFSESCGCETESPDDFREFKKKVYNSTESSNANISMLNRLTARLAETETPEEHVGVIGDFIEEIGCEKFCLCLSEDWQEVYSIPEISSEDGSSYSRYITAPLIWDKGERRSKGYFSSCNMYPEEFTTGGNISYFMPLHFRERCQGYYIITNGDFPVSSLLCHTLTMAISNSIENIRKLFHLNNAMDELNKIYVIDPLCNIYNRNGFITRADDMYKECLRKKKQIMLSFIDMDGLKFINDNYGHNEGDFAIQRLAGIIGECCDKSAICARFGGDEFVIFDTNAGEGSPEALARKFAAKLEAINAIIKKPYTISASIGSVLALPTEEDTLYSFIKQADDKMYEIKKNKKNARRSGTSGVSH